MMYRPMRQTPPSRRVPGQRGRVYHQTPQALRAPRAALSSAINTGMSETPERHAFQTEVRELLDLMIHSLYSHKDIFLRELISNASDALDKLRFEALSRPDLAPPAELEIRLETDTAARTLSIHDNGIGMTRDEVVSNIGT